MHIYNEPVYDLNELARYNLHVHTVFSRCAKPEMLLKDIVATAEAAGVEMIALTDHYNFHDYDECYLAQIRLLKRQAAALGTKLRILFSGELSNYGVGKQLESAETVAALDSPSGNTPRTSRRAATRSSSSTASARSWRRAAPTVSRTR